MMWLMGFERWLVHAFLRRKGKRDDSILDDEKWNPVNLSHDER